jgi:hypothetical protein
MELMMKFKNFSVALIAAVILAGCQPSQPTTVNYILPQELNDCKVFKIDAEYSPELYVVRCGPGINTVAQYQQSNGKTSTNRTTILIDGEVYEKVERPEQ